MEKKTSKNCCPYCGSEDIRIWAKVQIACHMEKDKDGAVFFAPDECYYHPEKEEENYLLDAMNYSEPADQYGYCFSCGKKFDVDHWDSEMRNVYFSQVPEGEMLKVHKAEWGILDELPPLDDDEEKEK